MTALGIVWVVVTPYLLGLVVASTRWANRLVARHLLAAHVIGWSAVAALLLAVFGIRDHPGGIVTIAAAPFVGLVFWKASRGGGGDEPPEPGPDEPPPSGDTVDWDAFLGEVTAWSASRERAAA